MKMSCGLFGLAQDMEHDFWRTMRNLKQIGFDAVEPLVAYPGDPSIAMIDQLPPFLKVLIWSTDKIVEMKPQFEEIGLTISSGHVGFAPGTNPADFTDSILEAAEITGIKHFLTSMTFDTKEKAEYCADQLSKVNQKLNPHGISLGYHNHEMEFRPMEDETEVTLMDYFLSVSDKKVKLQLDTGWQMYAGSDVLKFIKKYKNRIQSIHLKDFVKVYQKIPKEDAFAAIGDGALPVREILAIIPELDLFDCGLMIDQDKAAKGADLQEDLAKGLKFLKNIGETNED